MFTKNSKILRFQNEPYSLFLRPGYYKIECWGAEGGSPDSELYGGRGAYASGILHLDTFKTLFFYVGQKGSTTTGKVETLPPTFNGGGSGGLMAGTTGLSHYGSSGGGASDVRTVGGDWNVTASLKSRIIIAAGGGGASACITSVLLDYCKGGNGGALIGGDGVKTGNINNINNAGGGTQESGGLGGIGNYCSGANGSIGIGGNGGNCYSTSGGGGSGVSNSNHQCAGGGSSFISGFPGSEIKEFAFKDPIMISGDNEILSVDGVIQRGNKGDGCIKITLFKSICSINKFSFFFHYHSIFIMIMLIK